MAIIEKDRYFIATTVFIFGVEGLVDIANKVDKEAEGLSSLPGWEASIHDSLGMIGDCGDDASFGKAVTGYVDSALTGRVVLRVDVVPGCGVVE
jgi:hypothetical protein